MTQHNLTQILKVIRDLVMRNRPCYRDYLGTETVTTTMQIGSGTFAATSGYAEVTFPATDSAFTGFILGKTYTVTIDGVTADCVARNISPLGEQFGPVIGTATTFDMEEGTFDGWIAVAGLEDGAVLCLVQSCDMSFAGKTVSISQTKTETVKRYKTKLLPEYLLPAFLRRNVVASKAEVQSAAAKATAAADAAADAASTAQTTANTAHTTANAAQTTANAAQTTANAAKTAADSAIKPINSPVGSNECWYDFFNKYAEGEPCHFALGDAAGPNLSIVVNENRPSVRLIPPAYQSAQADFEFSRRTNAYPYPKIKGISGVVMHSSTSGSDKQFLITVDDTGTLTATEVTS